MKEYHLTLAGLRTVLRTPYEVTVSDNMRPFLCEPHTKIDCAIELQSCAQLPNISEGGVWNGPEYYESCDGAVRNFHCDTPYSAAFAITEHSENGNIKISVLPEKLHYFTGSGGIFNRINMETLLLQHFGLLLHASLIKFSEKAIVFTGPSGIGKSTQANIWHRHLGAEIINGDRAAIRKDAGRWTAYGSPYAGTSGIYKNDSAPLSAIIVLRQAEKNRLQRITPTEAFRHIYPELSIHHWDKTFVAKATDLAIQLLADVPAYLLECRPEESAALLVKKGLML